VSFYSSQDYLILILRITHILLGILLLAASSGFAQKKDNVGREFYVGFGENQGTNEADNSMQLYITGSFRTNCRVVVPAIGFDQTVLVEPKKITVVDLPHDRFAQTVELTEADNEQVVSGKSVHILADTDITVYGLNHKAQSSDAFLAFPVDALGTEYITINYSVCTPQPQKNIDASFNALYVTGSEFWVIATENATSVTITPKGITRAGHGPGSKISIELQKGDTYLVQGDVSSYDGDLTGSEILADKPVAVFSGHVRADVPQFYLNSNSQFNSRDHLVEQLPPVSAWGDSGVIAPFSASKAILPDVVRIVGSQDHTILTFNGGTGTANINRGEIFEMPTVNGPVAINATHPILIGQYMHSSISIASGQSHGDPALAIIYPFDQFDSSYTFISIQNNAYTDNFINVVITPNGVKDITLDGKMLSPSLFKPISGTSYYYAQIDLDDPNNTYQPGQGSHIIRSSVPFGLTVYGLGEVDSYAYPGGTLIKPLEVRQCGQQTLEDMVGTTVAFSISTPYPSPGRNASSILLIGYTSANDYLVSWTVFNDNGIQVLQQPAFAVSKGQGTIQIPVSQLPASGVYHIEFTVTDAAGSVAKQLSAKFSFVK
jgi:adhesin/invasin